MVVMVVVMVALMKEVDIWRGEWARVFVALARDSGAWSFEISHLNGKYMTSDEFD